MELDLVSIEWEDETWTAESATIPGVVAFGFTREMAVHCALQLAEAVMRMEEGEEGDAS